MQTFLPYSDFARSARALDTRRLNKQVVECSQIVRALLGERDGWRRHPSVRMWRGHVAALLAYQTAMHDEWRERSGRPFHCSRLFLRDDYPLLVPSLADPPAWLGDEAVHASHRSNLLRKDPKHYGALGWTEPADLPYPWPV